MTKLYHITHIRNLETIIDRSGILCDAGMSSEGLVHVGIAHKHIKERRARKRVPLSPGGTLADYVPFYFAPSSPMLYAIYKSFVEGYTEGQSAVLHLVTSVDSIIAKGLPFVFTNGHAEMMISDFYDNIADLKQIDWEIMKATYWNDTDQDNDRSRRRQAEFLVHQFFPWNLIEEIGVISEGMAERANEILSSTRRGPKVSIHKTWYY